MPATPTVFRGIRSNDYQSRPFRAYKQYTITNASTSVTQYNAIYTGNRVDVNDTAAVYPLNSDGTNQHTVWDTIDHRYYRYPYDPARSHELTNRSTVEKHLDVSASIVSIPYLDVGERIKPGSVSITATPVNTSITLRDDSNGNLRDPLIDTSSFASSSRNVFYMSFNDEFRRFPTGLGTYTTGSFKYILNGTEHNDASIQGIRLINGVTATNTSASIGNAAEFPDNTYIRIPHNDLFNKLQRCDDWTLSFWHRDRVGVSDSNLLSFIINKHGVTRERYITDNGTFDYRDLNITGTNESNLYFQRPEFWKTRTPIALYIKHEIAESQKRLIYIASDGTQTSVISGSFANDGQWHHMCIRNSASICELFIDTVASAYSGSLPNNNTATSADIMIGAENPESDPWAGASTIYGLAEMRLYDYAVSNANIQSLANRHFLSASCLQTNVVGNVFYRNGHAVVSTPLPRYNSGSGFFGNTWSMTYKGQHTIYENEVLVRVPADQLNVSMNPSATYRPSTGDNNACNTDSVADSKLTPGELRKPMFVSGSVYPYITTIGLYNDNGEMLAVGKLASPVQKRDDVDMNFIVRWDY